MFLIAAAALTASSQAFAKDSKQTLIHRDMAAQKMTQPDASSSTALNFAPDGLAREVLNLMAGIRRPIDDSMSVTLQAGTGFRVGLSF